MGVDSGALDGIWGSDGKACYWNALQTEQYRPRTPKESKK